MLGNLGPVRLVEILTDVLDVGMVDRVGVNRGLPMVSS